MEQLLEHKLQATIRFPHVVVEVVDFFVPQEFAWDSHDAQPQRGGPLYRMGIPVLLDGL